jgi:hypothetical protein
MSQPILAFDIAIKTLAFCIIDNTHVKELKLESLLDTEEKTKCEICNNNASFDANYLYYCKKHVPSKYKFLENMSGELCSKIPSANELKKIIKHNGLFPEGNTKDDLIKCLKTYFVLPYSQPKGQKASTISINELFDRIHIFVNKYWTIFSTCKNVLFENQPVHKNPHMKTTQILLYSIIRNKFIEENILDVNFHQISANRKSKGATKGNEGYKERKNITIERLKSAHEKEEYVFENNIFENWKNTSKKDDMADAFCMCVDFYNKTK